MSDDIQKEAQEQAVTLKAEIDAVQVIDQDSYNAANEIAAKAAKALKKIDETCDPVIDAAHKAHKASLDQKKKLREPIEALKKAVECKMITWYRAEQARADEERRKREEEARIQAEEEALRNAEALQREGMTAAADAVLEAPVVVPKVTVEEPAKAGGESYRATWSAEVVDLMALIKSVAEGRQPPAYLLPNMTALNGAARMFKGTVQIPGVKIQSETVIARRTA